jgi:repressor LexA
LNEVDLQPHRTRYWKTARLDTRFKERAEQVLWFTPRQGQFLAFIHLYWKQHRQAPAEIDLVRYFRLTPPAVHDMIVRLHELGLIMREPGRPRSVRVAIPEEEVPDLEASDGPAC